jgi:restriction system protein
MALWLVRAGRYGQHERHFLDTQAIHLLSPLMRQDLSRCDSREALEEALREAYPEFGDRRLTNYTSQLWTFVRRMKPGDWVVLPRKEKAAIAVAEILGDYTYDPAAAEPYFHGRTVRWLNAGVPRSVFDPDLLYSFGALLTICEIRRNQAESRVRRLAEHHWKSVSRHHAESRRVGPHADEPPDQEGPDLEQLGRDQIAKLIEQRFKGHGMARLVAAVLQIQGYTTHVSPEGADAGVDILAAPGSLGFGRPRICVQVKSGEAAVDRPTLDQLIGAMQNVGADQGLLVSWSGFKSSVDRETVTQFFRVRLWDAADLVENVLEQYDRLPGDLRAELPLKRIWTPAASGDET